MAIDSKRIAKNTIYLYIRFIFVLLVNLYSSRILLEELGVTDFSIYNTVYSVVGFLTFLSSTLSTSTSRFITFELGRGDKEKLKITYSTTWSAHVLLSLIVIGFAETIGLWYVCNVMVLPFDRYFVESNKLNDIINEYRKDISKIQNGLIRRVIDSTNIYKFIDLI